MNEKPLMGKEETCGMLDISEDTFWKMCRDGVLPAVKIGKRWYVYRDKLLGGGVANA